MRTTVTTCARRSRCYSKRMVTSKAYLMDTTALSPFALLLFGGRLQLGIHRDTIVMERWITFKCTEEAAMCLIALRREIDACLLRSVNDPSEKSRSLSEPVVTAVAQLLHLMNR